MSAPRDRLSAQEAADITFADAATPEATVDFEELLELLKHDPGHRPRRHGHLRLVKS